HRRRTKNLADSRRRLRSGPRHGGIARSPRTHRAPGIDSLDAIDGLNPAAGLLRQKPSRLEPAKHFPTGHESLSTLPDPASIHLKKAKTHPPNELREIASPLRFPLRRAQIWPSSSFPPPRDFRLDQGRDAMLRGLYTVAGTLEVAARNQE